MRETEHTLETPNGGRPRPGAWGRALGPLATGLLAAPEPAAPAPLSRGEAVGLFALAAAAGLWVFAFQLQRFLGLGTTSDLYVWTQLATSWIRGDFLHDNFYGNHLAIHTYLFGPVLGLLAWPFGAVGLFVFLGQAAAAHLIALTRILRLFGVGGWTALGYALAATLMPLSVHVYQDNLYGFHVELLQPAVALWLAYFLLRRRWAWSVALALVLISFKEDAPLLVILVAAVVVTEDFIRSLGGERHRRWNAPALTVILLGLLAVPVLLFIIKSQQVGGEAVNLARLKPVGAGGISNHAELYAYVFSHAATWLRSVTVAEWMGISLAATFGLVVLRPHLLAVGLPTTLVAWLMQDSVFWAPRFAPALVIFQLAGVLAFASLHRLMARSRARRSGGSILSGVLAVLGVAAVGWGLHAQWQAMPTARDFYRMTPPSPVSAADREKADQLFALYRREGRREDPVVASQYLFRYAHDRNLFWPHTMAQRPKPVWILWDTQDVPLNGLRVLLRTDAGLDFPDFQLKGRDGRFLLLKRREEGGPGPVLQPEVVPVSGETQGALRMQVRFAAGRAGHHEPLVSLGTRAAGEVFFVHYLSERQLVVGMERIGVAVHRSRPVDYEPGRHYELELFSGSMARPVTEAGDPDEKLMLVANQPLVRVRWDGEQILDARVPSQVVRSEEVYFGANMARSSSAGVAFTGEITDVRRGGYPAGPAGGLGDRDHGAARLMIWPPAAAAGVPEPLLVVGEPGRATLGYVRVLPGGQVKLGAEFWGVGAHESEAVDAPSDVPAEVVIHFPALYPPVGDPRWGKVERVRQEARRSRLTMLLNGRVVLDREVGDTDVPPVPVAFGENPVGGSLVTHKFSGLLVPGLRRLRLDAP